MNNNPTWQEFENSSPDEQSAIALRWCRLMWEQHDKDAQEKYIRYCARIRPAQPRAYSREMQSEYRGESVNGQRIHHDASDLEGE